MRLPLPIKGDACRKVGLPLPIKGDMCWKAHLSLPIKGDACRELRQALGRSDPNFSYNRH
jgi:hypothetical protein